MIKKISQCLIYLLLLYLSGCNTESYSQADSFINTKHLDDLFDLRVMNGDTVGIIHIYSEYPDYKWIDDDDEGTACVDDAARALIFYMKHYENSHANKNIQKAKYLLRFILNMQANNGYFYNFIWNDGSINKTFKTSEAKQDWWSWRALWALTESYNFFNRYDRDYLGRIQNAINKIVSNIKSDIPVHHETKMIEGIKLPAWLPYETASDQASLLVIGLVNYYQQNRDEEVKELILHLCDGILLMQAGDEKNFPHYAFLSWQNKWHGWGNIQSYAMLLAGKELQRKDFVEAALNEINHFYVYLLQNGFLNEFTLYENSGPELISFAQIAYIIRPMVYACVEAYNITRENIYAEYAGKIAAWLAGNNKASIKMYEYTNGICFDGLNSVNEANKNSGAESTIEALLTLHAVESIPLSKEILRGYASNENEK